jgi:hypothetical protein
MHVFKTNATSKNKEIADNSTQLGKWEMAAQEFYSKQIIADIN